MKLNELLLYYQCERQKIAPRDKKKSEHQFILNVHKAYQYYTKVDDNLNVSIETILGTLDALFTKYHEALKPTSMRNYIRWMKSSLTEPPLNDILSVELKEQAVAKFNEVLKSIHIERESHSTTDQVSTQDDIESVMDLDSIIPINEVSEPDRLQQLIEENNQLKEEIAQLRLEREKDAIRLQVCERLWRIIESKH